MITISKPSDRGLIPRGLSRMDSHFHATVGEKKEVTVTTLAVRYIIRALEIGETDDPLAIGLSDVTQKVVDSDLGRLKEWKDAGLLPTDKIGLEFKETLKKAGVIDHPRILVGVNANWNGDDSKPRGFMVQTAFDVRCVYVHAYACVCA